MKRLASAALAVAALAAGTARADTPPSAWDAAKDPGARARWQLHRDVREQIDTVAVKSLRGVARDLAFERARASLEAAHAADSPDPRLRFDLGVVYEDLQRHDRAVEVLEKGLELAPDHPAAPEAWVTLAYAGAKLDRPALERRAYVEYLRRVSDDRPRSTALLNLAEAEMRLGNLDRAITGYHDALRASVDLGFAGQETYTLGLWGLAVALDRAGDPVGSKAETRRALSHDPGMQLIGFGPNVFFVPAYERLWYLGLGYAVTAEDSRDPREARDQWELALRTWEKYAREAQATERWLPLARAHLAWVQKQKKAADARALAAPLLVDPPEVTP